MDARAIHPGVRKAVRGALGSFPAGTPLRALEVGGGAGGAFRRWTELLAPHSRAELTVTDRDPALLDAYRQEALRWAGERGSRRGELLRIEDHGRILEVRFLRVSAPEGFLAFPEGSFALLAAQSFWDLLPPGTALPLAGRLLAPGGVFYAALTFSGSTRFDPPLGVVDRRILDRYHASMEGARGGDSRAGERLIEQVRAPGSGFCELASGRSDWRVVPDPAFEGGYPGDERFFLETLLGFIEKELRAAPEISESERSGWLAARRRQLAKGRLSFSARQHDLAARRDP